MDIYDQIKRDEGFRAKMYIDTTGNATIGYGWNLSNGITESLAEIIMKDQADEAATTLNSHLPWFQALDPVRQAVLVNMCFNMGFKDLEGFTNTLSAIAQGNWDEAAAEMLDSKWASQVGDRAKRLADQMRTGEWV